MKIAVWDTYVQRKPSGEEGKQPLMHFDILVPEGTPFEDVQVFGRLFLDEKNESDQALTTKECQFCHIESATPEMKASIASDGYIIIEMEGCET